MDDRPIEAPEDAIARQQREFDDFKTTYTANQGRHPTGDIETSLLAEAKPNTLICNGATYNRADYPELWAWAVARGRVTGGFFGNGNGTTTFTVPNFVGRQPVGAGTLGSDVYALGAVGGASTKTIATANLPVHDHNVAVSSHATHDHGVSVGTHFHSATTSTDGSHGNHGIGGTVLVQDGNFYGVIPGQPVTSGSHSHSFSTNNATPSVDVQLGGPTTHTVTESTVGSGTALDVRQPWIAVTYLIWI